MKEEKLVICSDSHGTTAGLEYIQKHYSREYRFLHCGDSVLHPYQLEAYGFTGVQGNNDYYDAFPMHRILNIGNHRIYMCHGHRDMFFNNYGMLAEKAKIHDCDIAVCGHSHIYHHEVIDGITCLNPGSIWRSRDLSEPSYMTVILTDDDIQVTKHIFRHGFE